jgi:hypothetical protein
VIVLCSGCETPKIISPGPDPVAKPEPVQPSSQNLRRSRHPNLPTTATTAAAPPPSPKAKVSGRTVLRARSHVAGRIINNHRRVVHRNTRNWRILADANSQLRIQTKSRWAQRSVFQKMLRTREEMPQGFVEVTPNPRSGRVQELRANARTATRQSNRAKKALFGTSGSPIPASQRGTSHGLDETPR